MNSTTPGGRAEDQVPEPRRRGLEHRRKAYPRAASNSHRRSESASHIGKARVAWCATALLLALAIGLPAAAEPIIVAPDVTLDMAWVEPWSTLFAGREHKLHLTLEASQDFDGTFAWELQALGRVLQRQEGVVNLKMKQRTPVEVVFTAPPVKETLGVQAQLVATVRPLKELQGQARVTKALWLFSPDVFALNRETLSKRDIRVFDPERNLAPLLDKAGLTWHEVASAEQIAAISSGILLIGAGVNLADYRDLGVQLATAASNGAAVICLTPAGGALPLPGSNGAEMPRPQSVEFRGIEVLHDLDKRLDLTDWAANRPLLACGLRITGDRDRAMLEIGKPAKDTWPWFLARYATGGCLLLTGFPIVETWDLSPNPRVALLKMLELTAGK